MSLSDALNRTLHRGTVLLYNNSLSGIGGVLVQAYILYAIKSQEEMFRLWLQQREKERDNSGQIEIPSRGTDSTLLFTTGTKPGKPGKP